ncbi:MAG: FumA C-terminus/TtdB family hydratase beta subunit [Nanoarchaeota archaeon]
MKFLQTPIDEEKIRELKVGDKVLITGLIYTGRDQVHKFLTENISKEFKDKLDGMTLYHCGPIVRKIKEGYEVVAAGPTTSIREEPYESTIIKEYGIKAIIGKGGMGENTSKALQEQGCVYLSAIGGLAALLARQIKKVDDVYFLDEFGVPEAMWKLEVEDFPCIVTMDSYGNNLHDKILEKSKNNFLDILKSRRLVFDALKK